jgi:heme oxygenase (biliverdin-IX-beta and delta-forming)
MTASQRVGGLHYIHAWNFWTSAIPSSYDWVRFSQMRQSGRVHAQKSCAKAGTFRFAALSLASGGVLGPGAKPINGNGLMRISDNASAREYLKLSTRDLHGRLDAAAGVMRLETYPGYGDFLAAHAAALIPLEAALERGGIERLLPDWALRRRSIALSQDLEELGLFCEPLAAPVFKSDAALMGAAYVLEGSRLGTFVILSRVGKERPTRYLGHGGGMKFWPRFLDALEGNVEVRRTPQVAVAAARAAFSLFIAATPVRAMAAAS